VCVSQVEVSAMGRSLVQRSPTDCGVSLCGELGTSKNEEALARVGLLPRGSEGGGDLDHGRTPYAIQNLDETAGVWYGSRKKNL
jgi:hypothetical protein